MEERDNRIQSDGNSLFIIRNGQKIAKHEDGPTKMFSALMLQTA